MIQLLENKELREEWKIGRGKAELFSWESVTDETIKLYENVEGDSDDKSSDLLPSIKAGAPAAVGRSYLIH